MKKIICILYFITALLNAQSFQVTVISEETKQPIPQVTVGIVGTTLGAVSDSNGNAYFATVPTGEHTLRFSCLGYETLEKVFRFPHLTDEIPYVELEPGELEIEEVVISSTRGSRLLKDEPNRVETISGEEIDEKISMESSNIAMMLSEMPGIEVRAGNPFTGSSGFAIQGLPGKYTMMLRDGFPEYSGYSGSLSLQQVAPVDIKQIEVIKGSSSTLYGGGAIGGLVNLISKTPLPQQELSLIINGTTAGGYDVSGFAGKQYGNAGYTLLLAGNKQKAYDGNGDNITDLQKEDRYTIAPRLFWGTDNVETNIGVRYINEQRSGGYIPGIENRNNFPAGKMFFVQDLKSERFTSNAEASFKLNSGMLRVRAGFYKYTETGESYPNNLVTIPEDPAIYFKYKAVSETGFGDGVYTGENFVAGISHSIEKFTYNINKSAETDYSVTGLFTQYTIKLSDVFVVEPGLRLDIASHHTPEILPRIVALYKPETNLTVRLGYGAGYKYAAALTEETEGLALQNLNGNKLSSLLPERSSGIQGDITWRFTDGGFASQINQLFFYNAISNTMRLRGAPPIYGYRYTPENDPNVQKTYGLETSFRFTYAAVTLSGVHTYVHTDKEAAGGTYIEMGYDIRHRAGFNLIYEKDGMKAGYELYISGEQRYADPAFGVKPGFALNGVFLEKRFGSVSVFINCENLYDVKQDNPLLNAPFLPSVQYARPGEGRVFNGGVKIKI